MDEEMKRELNGIKKAIATLAEGVKKGFDGVDRRLDKVDARLDKVDGRLDKVDGRLDTMDGRFDAMDRRFDTMDGRLDRNEGVILNMAVKLSGLVEAVGESQRVTATKQDLARWNRRVDALIRLARQELSRLWPVALRA